MAQPLINITRRQALIFAAFLVLYEFLTYIANDMIMPAMLSVVRDFKGSESAVATSLTAYILGGASLQLFLGPLSDRYGRRPIMLTGALLFFIFTIGIACTQSIDQFLIARFFQGMGLCFIGVIGYATIQEIFAEMDAIRLTALMANIAILAPLLGPLAGAVFIHYLSWHYIFIFISFFALTALWGLWRFMPETVGETTREGHYFAPTSLSISTILKNYRELLSNKSFMLLTIAIGLIGAPCVTWIALAPIILMTDAHLSVLQYGLWQIPIFSACIVGNIILHKLSHKLSATTLIYIGSIISLSGLILSLLPAIYFSGYALSLIPGLIIYFCGLSMASAPLNRIVLFTTQVTKGTASALNSMLAMVIQSLCIEITNQIYITHNNILFALACTFIGGLYWLVLWGAMKATKAQNMLAATQKK